MLFFVRIRRRARKKRLSARTRAARSKVGRAKYALHKDAARALVAERILQFNQHYRLTVVRISIRNTTSRWGSCSRRGTLNFNYRVVFLPPALLDYVIVHELSHLAHFDHSPAFWAKVAETIPDAVARRRALRLYEKTPGVLE